MKKRSFFHSILLVVVFISGMVMPGCKKENSENSLYREAAVSQAIADNVYTDVMNQVNLAESQAETDLYGPGSPKSVNDCATLVLIPWDTITWPKSLVIDFGSSNCLGKDGKYRRGVLNAIITGRYKDSLTVITITPEDYYVNDYKVDGVKTVTNLGHITDGKMTFSVSVEDAVITKQDGNQFHWQSNRTRVWVSGEATAYPIVFDDVFEIGGEASGTTYNGINFQITTSIPLRIERDCEWIVSGALEITPEGHVPRTLDYGDGNCDNKASITVNGTTYQVTLP